MREILFRGKRADNGEWETGSLDDVNAKEEQLIEAWNRRDDK